MLASVGIFALVSYSVGQRQREFGIRAALGARAGAIVMLAVRQGVTLTAIGIGLGLLVSFGLTRFMAGLLVGVAPTDPVVFAVIVLILGAVALAACVLPSRRAATVDPLTDSTMQSSVGNKSLRFMVTSSSQLNLAVCW